MGGGGEDCLVEDAVDALFLKFKRTTAGDGSGEGCAVTEADVSALIETHGAKEVMRLVDDKGCNVLHHAMTFFGPSNDRIAEMLLDMVRSTP